MIVATIGLNDYELASMADAEALLNILARATPLDSQYTPDAGSYWIEHDHARSINIEITAKKTVSREQHEAFKAAAKPKVAA